MRSWRRLLLTKAEFDLVHEVTERDEAQAAVPVLRIEPSKGWVSLKLGELWEYRELLYFLTWRDIKVRYKQTVLGAPVVDMAELAELHGDELFPAGPRIQRTCSL